jgi:transcriptional regulator with XRE-family HTH domain
MIWRLYMKKSTTAERLQWIMKERRLRQVDILEAAKPYCEKYNVKLARNALSQYVNGTVEPGQQKLSILGMALNVSEAWLMGYDVPMTRETPADENTSKRVEEFSRLFAQLDPEQMGFVISSMKGLLSDK